MPHLSLVVLISLSGPAFAGDTWPGFLAGQRAGAIDATLPTTWDTAKNVLWKTAVPGTGWSSPIVWGDRVFVTSAVSSDKLPEQRKGLYLNNVEGKSPPGKHDWQVHCLDAKSGKVLWSKSAFQGPMTHTIHVKNSLASETPVTDGKHVWAYFGNVGVACFDYAGNLVWQQKTPAHKTRMGWGTGASPALADGKLFLVHDNEEKSSLLALDTATGKQLWCIERDEKSNWATPLVWKNSQRTEVVTAGTNRVRSYDLDGKPLWDLAGMSLTTIPTPIASGDILYVSSGYPLDLVKPIYAIRPGGKGDISLTQEAESNAFIAWRNKLAGPHQATPVVVDDLLYVVYDLGFLACHDAKTGATIYPRKRLGGNYTASPWSYHGKVFCLNEDGETVVVEVGKEFKIVGRNKLDEMCLATPAIAGGSLFVRTKTKVYCLRADGK